MTAGILRSEWLRFRTVRSSWITLAVAVLLIVGLGAAISAARASHMEGDVFDPTLTSLSGLFFAQLAVGVLGVLLVSGEYATGMIRATFTAVPRRVHVMVARSVVFAVVLAVALMPCVFAAFGIGQRILSTAHPQRPFSFAFITITRFSTSLADPGVTRAVLGAGLYLVAIGMFGLALGWLIRHTAGAIATLVGLLFIVPLVVHFLPESWADDISPWLPSEAGRAVFTAVRLPHTLAPWLGFGVLVGYVAVALVLAGILLVRRDA
jgi:hypothetical protein